MGMTRREFLTMVGQAGGYSAAFLTMQGLGMAAAQVGKALPLAVAPGTGKGVKVLILGGGISGLVAAYEMKALGYECTVLEARERPGGGTGLCAEATRWFSPMARYRIVSSRRDTIRRGAGAVAVGTWDNAGLLPEAGVALEVEVSTSRSSFLQNDAANGGKPVVQRQVVNDTRGHVSELLAKCIGRGTLDQELTKEDRDRMLSFLRVYGSLDKAGKYNGSQDAGYVRTTGRGRREWCAEPADRHAYAAG